MSIGLANDKVSRGRQHRSVMNDLMLQRDGKSNNNGMIACRPKGASCEKKNGIPKDDGKKNVVLKILE